MIFDNLFWITAVLGILTALVNVLGSNIYDVQRIKRHRAKLPRRRPLISVIVYTRNQAALITECLDSLASSRYRKLEVIVIDNASTDGTAKLVRRYIKDHPKKSIKLYAKRSAANQTVAIQEAFKKYATGELILSLNQPLRVAPGAFHESLSHFAASADVLLPNFKLMPSYTLSGLFQDFWLLLKNRSNKMRSLIHPTYGPNLNSVICRRAAFSDFLRGHKLMELKMAYASDVILYGRAGSFVEMMRRSYHQQMGHFQLAVNTPPEERNIIQALPALVSLSSLLLGLTMPILLTYFAYIAIHLHEPNFLVISWIGLALYLLFAIWEDDQLRLAQKLKYVFLMPMTYAWFYLMALTHYAVVLTSYRVIRLRRA